MLMVDLVAHQEPNHMLAKGILFKNAGLAAVFCCVGALAIVGAMNHIKKDLLGWWLCERQVKSGGLNGRPEKLPDVCYSWWILSSLTMMNKVHWIEKDRLASFILDCQDKENGGISDRPDDAVDVFHTFFGVSGTLSLSSPSVAYLVTKSAVLLAGCEPWCSSYKLSTVFPC